MTPELRGQITAFVLRQLRLRDGQPATEELILSATCPVYGDQATRGEIRDVLWDMDSRGLVTVNTHKILKTRTYALTDAGQHEARQLG